MTEGDVAVLVGLFFGVMLAIAWLPAIAILRRARRSRTRYRLRVRLTTARDRPWRFEVDRLEGSLATRVSSGGANLRWSAFYHARRHARFDARLQRPTTFTKEISL